MGTVERNAEPPPTQLEGEWGEVPDDFEQLQREDPTLQKAFDTVTHIDDGPTEVLAALLERATSSQMVGCTIGQGREGLSI